MLPTIVNRLAEASVSISRVQSFLMCDEQEVLDEGTSDSGNESNTINMEGSTCGVRLKDATFVYLPPICTTHEPPIIMNATLPIQIAQYPLYQSRPIFKNLKKTNQQSNE